MKKPTSSPGEYKTLAGLLKATEKVLCWHRHGGGGNIAGQSTSMWLYNAEYVAKERFCDTTSVPQLRKKYSVTRRQDLIGGDALFGVPLPKRDYVVGDNVPGIGRIDEEYGEQFRIAGNWIHKRCFDNQARGG